MVHLKDIIQGITEDMDMVVVYPLVAIMEHHIATETEYIQRPTDTTDTMTAPTTMVGITVTAQDIMGPTDILDTMEVLASL